MDNSIEQNVPNYEEHIMVTLFAINTNLRMIKMMAEHRKIKVIVEEEEGENGEKEKIFKIKFDTATIIGALNERDACIGAYLYINEIGNIAPYVEYCFKHFHFEFERQKWNYANCRIGIYTESTEKFGMIMYPERVRF